MVSEDNLAVNLEQLTNLCVELSHPLTDLEYGNKKTDYRKARDLISELEKKTNALGRRIRDEVFHEVHEHAKENNSNYKGDITRFRAKE